MKTGKIRGDRADIVRTPHGMRAEGTVHVGRARGICGKREVQVMIPSHSEVVASAGG